MIFHLEICKDSSVKNNGMFPELDEFGPQMWYRTIKTATLQVWWLPIIYKVGIQTVNHSCLFHKRFSNNILRHLENFEWSGWLPTMHSPEDIRNLTSVYTPQREDNCTWDLRPHHGFLCHPYLLQSSCSCLRHSRIASMDETTHTGNHGFFTTKTGGFR